MEETCFSDPMQMHLLLNGSTVLDYFALSPFYDRNCNNQQVQMQRSRFDTDQPDTQEMLLQMTGMEYEVIVRDEPHLFVVQKQTRDGPKSVTPMAIYYIINGTVFQAPSLSKLLSTRIQTASMALGKAFHVAADRVHFSPTSGYKWKDASKADRPGQAGESAAAPGVISQSYDALLHLMQRDVFMAKHTTTTAAAAAAAPAVLEPVAPTPIPAAPIQPVGLIPSTPRSAGSSTGPDTGKTKAESQAGPASAKKLKTKK